MTKLIVTHDRFDDYALARRLGGLCLKTGKARDAFSLGALPSMTVVVSPVSFPSKVDTPDGNGS
jgi:hypothetical protein